MEGFKEYADSLSSLLAKGKSMLKTIDDEFEKVDKKREDAELKLKYAVQSYDEQVAKNTAYFNEFEEKKRSVQKQLEQDRKETAINLQNSEADRNEAEKLLAEVKRKDDQVTQKLEEISRIKEELERRKERAKEYAASL